MRRTGARLAALTMVAVIAASCGSAPARRNAGPIAPLPDDHALRGDAQGGESSGGAQSTSEGRLEFAHRIDDAATWARLAARPASSAVARTEVVKFLVDVAEGRTIWFIDTQRWDIHYEFARDHLSTDRHPVGATHADHRTFNVREYRRPERRFELGTIVHYLDSDLWTLELIGGDTLPGDRIVTLFQQLRGALWIGDRLRFRPMSPLHDRSIASVRAQLPIATADEVFAGVRYQPLTEGPAFGTLRVVRGALDPSTVRPDQILVLEQLPDEIPVVSGVISAQLQAPLGHVAILCANRGTPNMGLRAALDHPDVQRLDGRLVQLVIGPQEFAIREATLAQAEAAWAARRPAQPQVPRLDPRERRLVAVCDLRLPDAAFAGAKASQLGEVCSLGNIDTPGGFVVPVAHYLEHLGDSGIVHGLPQMLADPTFRSDATVRARQLAQVRTMIQSAGVEPRLVHEVRRRIAHVAPHARWILRSSTNAEDLAGFTGAGLYRSIVVSAGASDQEIANALREVWASVWLLGAYEEREWYRVDHRSVGMAILAQPFVDGASANGVAITANPYYEARPAYFVNAQVLGGSVTGAAGEEIPEQHLIYHYMQPFETELLARSSRSPGALLLDDAAITALHERLARIHAHFVGGERPRWPQPVNAVDVEFLLAGGRIVIVQARPYVVRWGPGQTF
ncbi:PEP/pyruvate-binding domain-containing protein [Sandaracinus amylolyticus]|uniref:PEP/pyruvate-binding domain-containing protein n=1 Tax=Sandaracinus amylolyticus TaxID=927083 RepID=UPI001F38424F|nr:PEP/pyruvate-binding domain-containing protein [Sandaracinus amylolyticus]